MTTAPNVEDTVIENKWYSTIPCKVFLKMKNTEGFNRIPQRILMDGRDSLIEPLTDLFRLVYRDKTVPGQWLISKIIPVNKKGDKKVIENYRPVANLCSVSEIFEKLILKRISELEIINGITLGGKQQHGFMKNKSTLNTGLLLQSLISRAMDNDCYVALAGIDLSAAVDVVDIELLIKRLIIRGLPSDVVYNSLKKVGLNSLANRLYYINDLIPLSWLNLIIDSFKVHCKKLFLTCREI